jgi:hypothetical protein
VVVVVVDEGGVVSARVPGVRRGSSMLVVVDEGG